MMKQQETVRVILMATSTPVFSSGTFTCGDTVNEMCKETSDSGPVA